MCAGASLTWFYVIAAAGPVWVWATLVMIGFVALSALTMWLTRLPVRRVPPPVSPPQRSDDEHGGASA